METLNEQFDSALGKVNLGDKVGRAKKAHEEVRDVLAEDATLKTAGIKTILIGSYGRDVAIWPGHDVDVFSKLPGWSKGPAALYDAVRKPLKDHYKDRLDDSGGHAVSVSFGDDFSVDVVAATESNSGHWVIPAEDATGDHTRWDATDPELLGDLAEKRNAEPKVNGQGAYKPIVKLARQVRAAHLGDKRPKGLYFEMLTYWAFEHGVKGTTFAELLASTLDRIAAQLKSGKVADDPALGRTFDPAPTADELSAAADVFHDLASKANAALSMEKCPAAAAWREILGRNGNGWVFPLPDDCDEKGNVIKSVTDISALGPQQARGFAAP